MFLLLLYPSLLLFLSFFSILFLLVLLQAVQAFCSFLSLTPSTVLYLQFFFLTHFFLFFLYICFHFTASVFFLSSRTSVVFSPFYLSCSQHGVLVLAIPLLIYSWGFISAYISNTLNNSIDLGHRMVYPSVACMNLSKYDMVSVFVLFLFF